MLKHAMIKGYNTKTKTIAMQQIKNYTELGKNKAKIALILAVVAIFSLTTVMSSLASADEYQEKIDALAAQNQQIKKEKSILSVEADSLADAVKKLQAQIDASQARINKLNGEIALLRKQIREAEIELAKQKKFLGESIKAMYVNGEISTVEMLASSSDLSDFFDKQQYQESVRNKIKNTLDKVTALKLELNSKKERVEKSLAEQKSLRAQLAAQREEKNRVLALNEQQQDSLENEIQKNNDEMSRLRAEQAAAYAAYLARNQGSSYGVGEAGNGGYPSIWADAPQDSLVDDWGMFNRECVSYVAWKVASTGRYMPYWGGVGNAYQWIQNARDAKIPVDNTPTRGSVVVWDSYDGLGFLGHVAYVEVVNADRSIEVSQYNFIHGQFSRMHVTAAEVNNLDFIHF